MVRVDRRGCESSADRRDGGSVAVHKSMRVDAGRRDRIDVVSAMKVGPKRKHVRA